MTRNETTEWAEREMAKAIDGKRNSALHAAKSIANKAYREGTDAAWSLMQTIVQMTAAELSKVFPDCSVPSLKQILFLYGYKITQEAVDAYKAEHHEHAEDSCYGLHVGDEFVQAACIGVVTGLTPGRVHILWSDGSVGDRARSMMNTAHPTGRHYGDLSDILTAMQKGPDHD